MRYELRLSDGRRVTWTGTNGEDAALRYADAHRGAVVVAWREANRHGLTVLGGGRIIP